MPQTAINRLVFRALRRFRGPGKPVRGAAGFTLVEIMVVVLLMALMAGAVIPAITPGKKFKELRNTAIQIADAWSFGHSSAATEGRRYRWIWDGEARRWHFQAESNSAENIGQFEPVSIVGRASESLPDGIGVVGVYFIIRKDPADGGEGPEIPPEITFYPDGHSHSVYMVLGFIEPDGEPVPLAEDVNPREFFMTVALNGVTGRVKVLRGNYVAEQQARSEEENGGGGGR